MKKKLHAIPDRIETSTVIQPDGKPYRDCLHSFMMDAEENLYVRVKSSSILDFKIHEDKFLCSDVSKDNPDYYVEIPKYSHLLSGENTLSSVISDKFNISNLSDFDLAMYSENQKDCVCLFSGKITRWSEEWVSFGNYKIRSHKFYNSKMYWDMKNLLKKTTVRDMNKAFAFIPTEMIDINGKSAFIDSGVCRIRLSTLSAEDVHDQCRAKAQMTEVTEPFSVTGGTVHIDNHFGNTLHRSASIDVPNGMYKAVVAQSNERSTHSQIVLCPLD
jgi:hypothetical protein